MTNVARTIHGGTCEVSTTYPNMQYKCENALDGDPRGHPDAHNGYASDHQGVGNWFIITLDLVYNINKIRILQRDSLVCAVDEVKLEMDSGYVQTVR